MKSLSPEDQVFLIQALQGNLAGIMQDAAHLRDLLATLAEEKSRPHYCKLSVPMACALLS